MPYYLDSYVGTGTRADPFRPSAEDTNPAACGIDLRPDSTKQAGFAIVFSPTTLPAKAGRVKIADDTTTVSSALVTSLQNRLGITLSQSSFNLADALADLLVVQARTDGTRWRPLVAAAAGRLEIWLGNNLIWNRPQAAGGGGGAALSHVWADHELERYASIARDLGMTMLAGRETFNQADSTTLGPIMTWTETVGNFDTVTQHLHLVTDSGASGNYARAEYDVGDVDVYAYVVITTSTNYSEIYSCARYAAAAQTFYLAALFQDGSSPPPRKLRKSVAGTESSLVTDLTHTFAAGEQQRIECQGSTIRYLLNGTQILTTTDTAITTGTRGGTGGYHASGGVWTVAEFDVGSMNDVDSTLVRPPFQGNVYRM